MRHHGIERIRVDRDPGLAAIVLSGMPGTLAWALGLLLGIDLLFGGVSLIAIALKARAEINP